MIFIFEDYNIIFLNSSCLYIGIHNIDYFVLVIFCLPNNGRLKLHINLTCWSIVLLLKSQMNNYEHRIMIIIV